MSSTITPDQQALFDRINALPVYSSELSTRHLEDGLYAPVEQELKDKMAEMKQAKTLSMALDNAITLGGKVTTLRQYAAEAKRCQIGVDGSLITKAQARRGEIRDAAGNTIVPDHKESREAYERAADFSKQDQAPLLFLEKLKAKPGAAELFADDVRVFDIGYHNGRVSGDIAKTLIAQGVPADKIHYDGMDLVPTHAPAATRALVNAGIPAANITLRGGKLGFTGTLQDGSTNEALTLTSTPADKKADIALALNVYNFGDRELFWQQVDGVMKDNAITIAMHDASGDVLELKQAINKQANRQLVRIASPVTKSTGEYFNQENRQFSNFSVPYTLTFPQAPDSAWQCLKQASTGNFVLPYERQGAKSGMKPAKYREFRALVEFVLGEPLGAFNDKERALVIDALHEKVKEKKGALSGTLETQVLLSRQHSKDLANAVEETCRECGREFTPMLETLRQAQQSASQSLPPRQSSAKK